VRHWLVNAIRRDDILSPKTRVEAGQVLAKLGDPRPEVMDVRALQFCHIPRGSFIMGEGRQQDHVILPDYWISKYPITNAQFKQFMDAGGYGREDLWKEMIEDATRGNDGFQEITISQLPGLRDYGQPFMLDNHPVAGISWYEATAFAGWLDILLKQQANKLLAEAKSEVEQLLWKGLANNTLYVMLPTGAQWEKAARGLDGRMYPWGDIEDPNLANYYETGIGSTNAVGCFPSGRSINGPEEMSGNVFEWVKTNKRLRGGSFEMGTGFMRCSFSLERTQAAWASDAGFRVAVAPISSR
jgi:formylglycine-generating enzyme required for sulfatase activity